MSRMRRLFAAVVLIAALPAAARADLHFSAPRVDLGRVRAGVPLSHRFSFRNAGTAAVTITDLRADCGCLAPRLDRKTCPPGGEDGIRLEVNTLSQPAGPNVWRLHVHSRDGDRERVQVLELRADLVVEVRVEPARLALHVTGPFRHEVTVTDLRPVPFRVTQTACSSPHVAARASPREAATPATFRVAVEVKESLPEGTHQEVLSVFTDDPDYRELRLPLTVVKRSPGAVSAAPAAVTLTVPRGQPAPSRIVLLRAAGDGDVRVDKIEADDPALVCRWAKGPGKMATLRVGVDAARVKDVLRGTVRVHVGGPSPSVVTIPVVCTVR